MHKRWHRVVLVSLLGAGCAALIASGSASRILTINTWTSGSTDTAWIAYLMVWFCVSISCSVWSRYSWVGLVASAPLIYITALRLVWFVSLAVILGTSTVLRTSLDIITPLVALLTGFGLLTRMWGYPIKGIVVGFLAVLAAAIPVAVNLANETARYAR